MVPSVSVAVYVYATAPSEGATGRAGQSPRRCVELKPWRRRRTQRVRIRRDSASRFRERDRVDRMADRMGEIRNLAERQRTTGWPALDPEPVQPGLKRRVRRCAEILTSKLKDLQGAQVRQRQRQSAGQRIVGKYKRH